MSTTLADLGRRIAAIEREAERNTARRTLGAVAIGRGGLRIYGGGGVKIEDGGGLEIVTGNLILGEGIVEDAWLKTQMTADFKQASGTITKTSTDWQTVAQATITPPSWADRIVYTFTCSWRAEAWAQGRFYYQNADVADGYTSGFPAPADHSTAPYDRSANDTLAGATNASKPMSVQFSTRSGKTGVKVSAEMRFWLLYIRGE